MGRDEHTGCDFRSPLEAQRHVVVAVLDEVGAEEMGDFDPTGRLLRSIALKCDCDRKGPQQIESQLKMPVVCWKLDQR